MCCFYLPCNETDMNFFNTSTSLSDYILHHPNLLNNYKVLHKETTIDPSGRDNYISVFLSHNTISSKNGGLNKQPILFPKFCKDTLQVQTHQLGNEGLEKLSHGPTANEDSITIQSLLALSNELQIDSKLLPHVDMCLLLTVKK